MLYLIQPDRTMSWCDMPAAEQMLDIARENDADLARLDWTPLERVADDDVVRLAVRRGVACSAGLVVAGIRMYLLDHPNELLANYRAAQSSSDAVRRQHDAWMERLVPGWTAERDEFDAGIAQTFEAKLAEAEREAADELAGEADADLVAHWQSLGGRLPTSR